MSSALWLAALVGFDFSRAGLQHETTTVWISDLGVSYKVGLYDFSLWLVGLTIVVMTAAMIYAMWDGRTRSRAYFGLLLLLLGATVGVFASHDLLAFYVFFEAMLIPLYVARWRLGWRWTPDSHHQVADLHPARLAAHARGDRGVRTAAEHVRPNSDGIKPKHVDLPGFHGRIRHQGATVAVSRLASGRLPRGSARGVGTSVRSDLQDRDLRCLAHRVAIIPRTRRAVSRTPFLLWPS